MTKRHAFTGPVHRLAVPAVLWVCCEVAARLFAWGDRKWRP